MSVGVLQRQSASARLLTAEEFLDWLEPGVHADLIQGEVVMHSPVSLDHADLLNFLDHLLRSFIEPRGLGRLYREVVAVRLGSRNVFLPDLAFFRTDQLSMLRPTHAAVAPTWVIEVLSPTTAQRDCGPKFAAYEEHGVDEYWILAPDKAEHRFFARAGEFLVEFGQGEPIIRSRTLPGFMVQREWLNPAKLPPVAEALRVLNAVGGAGEG